MNKTVVGWSEWVALPDLGVSRLKAKIDTGARTCALHVTALVDEGPDAAGRPMIAFDVPAGAPIRVRTPVVARVRVRDSGGRAAERPVIETVLELGAVRRRVRVTLTDRGEMRFPMLVGRTALRGEFVVDAGARYLLGRKRPTRATR